MEYHGIEISDRAIEMLLDNSIRFELKTKCFFNDERFRLVYLFTEDLAKIVPIIEEYGQDGMNALKSYIERTLPWRGYITPKFERALKDVKHQKIFRN